MTKLIHEIEQVSPDVLDRKCDTEEDFRSQQDHEIQHDSAEPQTEYALPIEVFVIGGQAEDEEVAGGYRNRLWSTHIHRVVATDGVLSIEVILNGEV